MLINLKGNILLEEEICSKCSNSINWKGNFSHRICYLGKLCGKTFVVNNGIYYPLKYYSPIATI